MSNSVRSLYIYPICAQYPQRVALAATSCSRRTVRRLGRVRAAAHDLWEEACETETDGGHANADYAYVRLDDGPEGSFEVIPCHISCVSEVDEGAKTDDGNNGYAVEARLATLLINCNTWFATHKVPTPNIVNTPSFFFVESCNPQICCTGSAKVMKSRRTLKPACANASELLLTHRPVCSPSHCNHA